MHYIVRPVIPQIKQPLKISEAEYCEIIDTRKLAWDILVVKEFFSYAVRNFSQLESEIQKIEIEANHNLDKFCEPSFACENTHIFNLLVMNLLTTYRSYLELFMYQSKHDKAKEIFLTKNEIRSILKNIKNEHHDNNIVCIFFWALFKKELDAAFRHTKTTLNQKVEYYCQDKSPQSVFEIYKQNEKSQELEERFDGSLQLINNWEQTIEKYSNLELLDKN